MCNLPGAICARISLVQENNCTDRRNPYTRGYGGCAVWCIIDNFITFEMHAFTMQRCHILLHNLEKLLIVIARIQHWKISDEFSKYLSLRFKQTWNRNNNSKIYYRTNKTCFYKTSVDCISDLLFFGVYKKLFQVSRIFDLIVRTTSYFVI